MPAPTLLLNVHEAIRPAWIDGLRSAAARRDLEMVLHLDAAEVDPAQVDYIVFSQTGPMQDLSPYTRLKAILNIWAGVEKVLANPTLPDGVPLCRMVESGMTEGMRDYIVAHVMRHHVDLDTVLRGVGAGWTAPVPPLARHRRVGLLGLGTLGGTVAAALVAFGFDVAGWSRSPKSLPGVESHAGPEGLNTLLARSEILACLLPRTAQTENLLDAARLARLPKGARLINAGRGELIDDAALLAALDSGHLGHATLDVFRQEPLPVDHPFRTHPGITVTPHIASVTRPATAAETIVAQVIRGEAGEPFAHVVDRARGY